jgi:hypothetical protein
MSYQLMEVRYTKGEAFGREKGDEQASRVLVV